MADYHVLPLNDLISHEESRTCWCQPRIEEEPAYDGAVVVHRSADGRERFEPEAVTPPAERH